MSFRDLPCKLSAAELDAMKHRLASVMRRAADVAGSRARVVIDMAYSEAHRGLLRAQTEDEVDRIKSDFVRAVALLRGQLDTFDEAFR